MALLEQLPGLVNADVVWRSVITGAVRLGVGDGQYPAGVGAGLGHFPMGEDHDSFAARLLPVLDEIEKAA
jgi:hypothetical protein